MFKVCMKNYFANLKYVFVALGVMFIALIIGAQVMFNKSVKEVNIMIDAIEATTAESDLSLKEIGDSVKDTVQTIGRNMNAKVLTGAEKPTKVEKSIGDSISKVVGNYIQYFGILVTHIARMIAGIIVAIIIFLLIQLLGLYTSSLLITIFGRYDIANDNIFKILLEQIVRAVLVILWMWIIVGVYFLSATVGLILAALFPLMYCFIALLGVWVTAPKDKKPKFTAYVTFGNVLVLFLCNLLQILIGLVIAAIAYFLGGAIVAVVFGFAILVLAVSNVNLNAYAFLYRLNDEKKAIEDKQDTASEESKDGENKEPSENNEVAAAEEPKTEEPKAEEVKAEEAKAEEVKAEEPKAEEPKAEEPKAEEAKAEEPKA